MNEYNIVVQYECTVVDVTMTHVRPGLHPLVDINNYVNHVKHKFEEAKM